MTSNPTFFLKKISHVEVLNKYLSGAFSNINLNEDDKNIKISSHATLLTEEFTNDDSKPIFINEISKYSSPILYSSNQKAFEIFKINGKLSSDELCDWCREDSVTMGMVVAHKRVYYDTGKKSITYDVFWVYGSHCSFECALGELYYMYNNKTSPIFDAESSITLTKILFNLVTGKPVEQLKATPYFRLLKSRGGSLEKSEKHKYISHPNLILAPAKVAFEKLNI